MKPFPLECSKLTRKDMTNSNTAYAGGPWLMLLSPCLETSAVPGNGAKETEVPLKELLSSYSCFYRKDLKAVEEKNQEQRRKESETRSCCLSDPLLCRNMTQSSSSWGNSNPNGVCLLFLCSWAHIRRELATDIRGKCTATEVTCREIPAVYSSLPLSCATGCLLTLPPLPLAARAANITLLQ